MKFLILLATAVLAQSSQKATSYKEPKSGVLQGLSIIKGKPVATFLQKNGEIEYTGLAGTSFGKDTASEYFGRSDFLAANDLHYARNEKLGQLVQLTKKGNEFEAQNFKVQSGFITSVQFHDGTVYVSSFDETTEGYQTTISFLENDQLESFLDIEGIVANFAIDRKRQYAYAILLPEAGQSGKKLIKFSLDGGAIMFEKGIQSASNTIAIDNKDNVYVPKGHNQVQVFNRLGNPTTVIQADHQVSKLAITSGRVPTLYIGGACRRKTCFSTYKKRHVIKRTKSKA